MSDLPCAAGSVGSAGLASRFPLRNKSVDIPTSSATNSKRVLESSSLSTDDLSKHPGTFVNFWRHITAPWRQPVNYADYRGSRRSNGSCMLSECSDGGRRRADPGDSDIIRRTREISSAHGSKAWPKKLFFWTYPSPRSGHVSNIHYSTRLAQRVFWLRRPILILVVLVIGLLWIGPPIKVFIRETYEWTINQDLHKATEARMLQSSPQPWDPSVTPNRGVALLINTYQGMETPTIWERWLQDALDYVEAEEGHRSFRVSKLLRPYVHHMWVFEPTSVAHCLPPSLVNAIIPEPFPCIYDNLNNCTRGLMTAAFHDFSEAEFFVYVSMNTVPLKPFRQVLADFMIDSRPRHNVNCPVAHLSQSAKASGWRMWRRDEIEVMLRRWREWVEVPLCNYAGANEIWTTRALVNEYGINYYSRLRCSRWKEVQTPCRPVSDAVCPYQPWTFECWENECFGERWPGYLKRPPFAYLGIEESFLRFLLESQDTHFIRKIREKTMVVLNETEQAGTGDEATDRQSSHKKELTRSIGADRLRPHSNWPMGTANQFPPAAMKDHLEQRTLLPLPQPRPRASLKALLFGSVRLPGNATIQQLLDAESEADKTARKKYQGKRRVLLYDFLSQAMNLTSDYVHPDGEICGSLPVYPGWNRASSITQLEKFVRQSCSQNVKPEYVCANEVKRLGNKRLSEEQGRQ